MTRHLIARLLLAGLITAIVSSCVSTNPIDPVSPPLSNGLNQVRIIVEPDDGSKPVIQFIGSARRTLDVAMYLLSDRDVIDALTSAEKRGVQVRMMLEEHPYGSGPGNDSVETQLRTAKVLTKWSPATFALSHDKYAVEDNQIALVGTANWTHSAFVGNREYLLVVTGPTEISQLEALFNADWNRQIVALDDPELVVSPVNSRANFVALIRSATSTLDLEAEEMQDLRIESELGQSAKRGVAVRVVLPASEGGTDSNAEGQARLKEAGVQVRALRKPYIHAKLIVADHRESFVGSENISTQSLDRNREVGLLVGDQSVVGQLESTFEKDWSAAR